jgi:hypothetical protein
MSSPDTDQSTSMQLVMPADPRMLRVLRLVASGMASLGAFDLDAVEEVRVAVDELGSTLIGASAGGPITLTFALEGPVLSIDASAELPGGELEVDPLTDRILDVVATQHAWRTSDGVGHGRIEKHARTA